MYRRNILRCGESLKIGTADFLGFCSMAQQQQQQQQQQPLVGQGLLINEASRSHSDTHHTR
jgi:hypothetical protein